MQKLSQIPAVRRGFCCEDGVAMYDYEVSDPCCTAGFLLCRNADASQRLRLRSLLYGGVFVD